LIGLGIQDSLCELGQSFGRSDGDRQDHVSRRGSFARFLYFITVMCFNVVGMRSAMRLILKVAWNKIMPLLESEIYP